MSETAYCSYAGDNCNSQENISTASPPQKTIDDFFVGIHGPGSAFEAQAQKGHKKQKSGSPGNLISIIRQPSLPLYYVNRFYPTLLGLTLPQHA